MHLKMQAMKLQHNNNPFKLTYVNDTIWLGKSALCRTSNTNAEFVVQLCQIRSGLYFIARLFRTCQSESWLCDGVAPLCCQLHVRLSECFSVNIHNWH